MPTAIKASLPTQNLEIICNKTFGGPFSEYIYAMTSTNDEGYLLAGFTTSFGVGSEDVWIIKVDSHGEQLWNKTYGTFRTDVAFSIKETSDGGFIFTGLTYPTESGDQDLWVLKCDIDGHHQWNRTYGGSQADYGGQIIPTSGGNYIVVGYTASLGAGGNDQWVMKIDNAGEPIWNHTYGGTGSDYASSVISTDDDGYLIVGATDSFGKGMFDAWIIKTNSTGDMQWNTTLGGLSDDNPYQVTSTVDGYVIAGRTESYGAMNRDCWVFKIDLEGNLIWNYTYGGVAEDYTSSISSCEDGGFVLAGRTLSFSADSEDLWILKISENGTLEWEASFGGPGGDAAYAVLESSNRYTMAGRTSSYGEGAEDVWFIQVEFQKTTQATTGGSLHLVLILALILTGRMKIRVKK